MVAVVVTGMTGMTCVTFMACVARVVVTFVPSVVVHRIVLAIGCTAVVPLLSLANQVVLLIALALVWRAVTFSARVVITRAHRWVCAVVFAVVLGTVTVLAVVIVL